jgi:glycosyltransferase involved in cell wall biosynthesis
MMFSVVICTFNRADVVGSAIDSALAQTYDDFELIVVDDGSTDRTGDVLDGYQTDPRFRAIRRPNGGLSAARNTGLDAATGRFVAFFDDDDVVDPDWLAGLAKGVDDSTGFTSCTCTLVSPDRAETIDLHARGHVIYDDIKGVFLAGTFALDRSILDEIGGYADEIRVSHQSELLLRALPAVRARDMGTAFIDRPLITIERREASDRPLSQPADLFDGAEYLIEHHGELLATKPHALANYHAIAGVSAAQLGDLRSARRHLLRAALTYPRKVQHITRFATSLVPPLARRTWSGATRR